MITNVDTLKRELTEVGTPEVITKVLDVAVGHIHDIIFEDGDTRKSSKIDDTNICVGNITEPDGVFFETENLRFEIDRLTTTLGDELYSIDFTKTELTELRRLLTSTYRIIANSDSPGAINWNTYS